MPEFFADFDGELARGGVIQLSSWDFDNGCRVAFRSFACEVPTTAINSDPLTYLLKKVGNVEHKLFRAESFAEAFPSLSKWAAHYDSLKLDDLDIVLGEQSKQSRGELEIFGAKIPNELVAWIGIPSLLLLLLQFNSASLLLLKIEEPLNINQASSWSLLFKGFGFSIFGFATMCALPVLASVMTVSFATPETWYQIPVWCSLTLCVIVLSGVSAINLDRLRRRITYADEPEKPTVDEASSADGPED